MTKTDLHILMLEDDPLDAELNIAQLQLLEEYSCIVKLVSGKDTFLKSLAEAVPDIILSDYNLPQYTGLDALHDVKKTNPLIPFIFITGAIDEETAVGTIKAGAWDYVVKDRLFRLPFAIRSALQLKVEKINTATVEAQNLKLSMAVEQSPVHIIIGNIDGIIEYVNPRFTEVTGYCPGEVIGKDVRLLLPENEAPDVLLQMWVSLKRGIPWRGEAQKKRKDGSSFWEYTSISPLKNKLNEITHFIAVKEDVTQRKKMEHDLIAARERAERSDKLKDAFLQNLSHEIRTPLNAIIGFSSLLNDPDLDKTEKEKFVSVITNSGTQLLSIVNDILTISRIQTGQEVVKTNTTYVNAVMYHLWTNFKAKADSKSLSLNLINGTDNPRFAILTDEVKLVQILTHLLNNAITFTLHGSIEIGYTTSQTSITFFIKDTGIGIEPESHEFIFERFRQANNTISSRFGGTGLGLAIAKSYADLIEGSIKLESAPNVGSVFYLDIPLRQK